jgi:hypothetical protein
MTFVFKDRVRDIATTTGTGVFTVSGTAPVLYRTFSSVCSVSDTLPYFIAHRTADEWEVGQATYSAANQLTRTTVLSSSNAGAAVSFSAGTKDVVLSLIADPTTMQQWGIGGGSPGGSTTQIQYNNAGTFAGTTGFTWDATNQAVVHTSIANPAVSTMTLTGGTALTTSQPVLNMTQTWNNAGVSFVGLKITITHTAATNASQIASFQIGSANSIGIAKEKALGIGAVLAPVFGVSGALSQGSTDLRIGIGGNLFFSGVDPLNTASYPCEAVIASNSNLRVKSSMALGWSSSSSDAATAADTFLTRSAAATLQHGAADAAAPIAQTISVQSVSAGTSNTAGADWTFNGSKGTGTGAGGKIIWAVAPAGTTGTSQNAAVDRMRLMPTGELQIGASTTTFIPITGALLDIAVPNGNQVGIQIAQNGIVGLFIGMSPGSPELQLGSPGLRVPGGNGNGQIKFGSSGNNAYITGFNIAGQIQLGQDDAAAPVAQTTQVQSVVAGTSNTAGADWTLQGSRGTGTGAGGAIVFKTAPVGTTGTSQNAAAEVARLLPAGNVKFTNAANFSANGSVATTLGSVGPTGAQTTVQEWLTFQDAAGTTRYVPCF